MAFFMGTDEAGYGPNLGPLTIGATLWQVPDSEADLYQLLVEAVTADRPNDRRLWLADSKVVYGGGRSLKDLETSVLACLAWSTGAPPPTDLEQLLTCLVGGSSLDQLQECPWLAPPSVALPLVATPAEVAAAATRIREAAEPRGVELTGIGCRWVLPEAFNQLLDQVGNKAELLSCQTLQLAAELKERSRGRVTIVADKHGGRRHYAGLVQAFLTPQLVQVGVETGPCSEYRFEEPDRQVEIRFAAGGEAFLPTALASMTAKYLREVSMEAWNRYWQQHVPGIRPTRGYPVDARRFKREIAVAQAKLGLPDNVLWRRK